MSRFGGRKWSGDRFWPSVYYTFHCELIWQCFHKGLYESQECHPGTESEETGKTKRKPDGPPLPRFWELKTSTIGNGRFTTTGNLDALWSASARPLRWLKFFGFHVRPLELYIQKGRCQRQLNLGRVIYLFVMLAFSYLNLQPPMKPLFLQGTCSSWCIWLLCLVCVTNARADSPHLLLPTNTVIVPLSWRKASGFHLDAYQNASLWKALEAQIHANRRNSTWVYTPNHNILKKLQFQNHPFEYPYQISRAWSHFQ